MIPIVREFFRGLKERHELDAIIPELLTAMGYEVISRPMVGTRQYGADVAAIGTDDDGIRKLFLFVIKKGDLTREEWDDSPAGSILYPVLAAFAWGLGDSELVAQIDAFQQDSLGHCNFQTWVPNARTEARIWQGERTGSSFGSLAIGEDGGKLLASLRREIEQNSAYKDLSAVRIDHWPVLLMACRAYRMPPPPQLWLPLLDELKAPRAAEAGEWVSGPPRSRGGKRRVHALLLRCASYTALMRGLQSTARFDSIGQIASI
jgi:hypothetical protein